MKLETLIGDVTYGTKLVIENEYAPNKLYFMGEWTRDKTSQKDLKDVRKSDVIAISVVDGAIRVTIV